MHPDVKKKNAAIKLRDILMPACPTRLVKGKPYKVLPVCFIHHPVDMADPILVYALPPKSKSVKVPLEIDGFKTHQKKWEGPAPKETQNMALKVFKA